MFRKYFLFLLLVPLGAFTTHKYYISLCEVEYVEKHQSIQIVIGIFLDDLEFTLNKNHAATLNLATPEELANIDVYYEEYLNEHLKITVNNSAESYEYIGKEYDGDLVRFYLEITNIQHLNSLKILNTALFRDFERQQNIIKIKVNKYHKTFYLNSKNDTGFLIF